MRLLIILVFSLACFGQESVVMPNDDQPRSTQSQERSVTAGDAPSGQRARDVFTTEWRILTPPPPRHIIFWSFEPMRSSHQTLKSGWFWGPQILQMGAAGADAWSNRNKLYGCCGKPMIHGWALGLDAGIPAAAIFGGSYVADRWLGRPIGVGIAAYGIIRHGIGAITGKYH